MIRNPNHRYKFIHSMLDYVLKFGFDGIHIDHEIFPQESNLITPFTRFLRVLHLNNSNQMSIIEN